MAESSELEKTLFNASDWNGEQLRNDNRWKYGVQFDEKMNAMTAKLAEQLAKGAELEKTIRENLKGIGYEF